MNQEGKKVRVDKARLKISLAVLLLLILIIIGIVVQLDFQLKQYEDIGKQYTDIFWINSIASFASMIICFFFIFLCFLLTNCLIIKNLKKFFKEENLTPKKLPNFSLAFGIAIVGAFLTKDYIAQNALIYFNAEMFNSSFYRDPIFLKNFGYYLFQRPFVIALTDFISGTLLAAIIYSIGYYVLAFGSIFNAIEITSLRKNGVVLHNLINISIFFLLKVFSYGLNTENILFSNNGIFYGADYTQHNIWLKIYTVAPFILFAIIIVAFILLMKEKYKPAIYTILAFPAYFVVGAIIAGIVQIAWVMPYETTRQKPYIRNNMELTKLAYNISYKLDSKEYDISDALTQPLIDKNKDVIDNFRLIDPSLIAETSTQLQSMRNYYKFKEVDTINYNVNGKNTAVFVSAREINQKGLDDKSYENLKFKYTHGYGIVMSPVNSLKNAGRPDYIYKDMPLRTVGNVAKITRPEIYYGELTKNHIVVNVKNEKEVDYPDREINQETIYTGSAGIRLTLANRFVMSIKLADPMLFFSRKISNESKVLINRDVVSRVKLAAPFLDVDTEDAYLVVNKDGRLVWIVDAYTTSNQFPYSQKIPLDHKRKINYIRNSVKVLVDAYDGTVRYYIVDTQDPVVMTYKKIYPNLFEKGQIPSDIAGYIKYPKRLMKIQAGILKRYSINDEAAFFKGKDEWEIPVSNEQDDKKVDMEPYYTMMKLPEAKNNELVLMMPFTSEDGTKITGLLAARPDIYSKMILYKFPGNRVVFGPKQLEINMDKEIEIAKVFDFWRQGGDRILKSDVLVLPIQDEKDKALLLIKPIFVQKDETQLPELRKVVVGYQGRIAMEDNIEKALQRLLTLGPYQEALPPELSGNKALIEALIKAYDELKAYSSANDWENFGKKMTEIDKIISEINKRKDEM
ncbi:MAG: UPF0182 family protein [Deltaproteobacteria bacterium]